jgi:predicted ATPase with chaperone activity
MNTDCISGYTRILRVFKTTADLEGQEDIQPVILPKVTNIVAWIET